MHLGKNCQKFLRITTSLFLWLIFLPDLTVFAAHRNNLGLPRFESDNPAYATTNIDLTRLPDPCEITLTPKNPQYVVIHSVEKFLAQAIQVTEANGYAIDELGIGQSGDPGAHSLSSSPWTPTSLIKDFSIMEVLIDSESESEAQVILSGYRGTLNTGASRQRNRLYFNLVTLADEVLKNLIATVATAAQPWIVREKAEVLHFRRVSNNPQQSSADITAAYSADITSAAITKNSAANSAADLPSDNSADRTQELILREQTTTLLKGRTDQSSRPAPRRRLNRFFLHAASGLSLDISLTPLQMRTEVFGDHETISRHNLFANSVNRKRIHALSGYLANLNAREMIEALYTESLNGIILFDGSLLVHQENSSDKIDAIKSYALVKALYEGFRMRHMSADRNNAVAFANIVPPHPRDLEAILIQFTNKLDELLIHIRNQEDAIRIALWARRMITAIQFGLDGNTRTGIEFFEMLLNKANILHPHLHVPEIDSYHREYTNIVIHSKIGGQDLQYTLFESDSFKTYLNARLLNQAFDYLRLHPNTLPMATHPVSGLPFSGEFVFFNNPNEPYSAEAIAHVIPEDLSSRIRVEGDKTFLFYSQKKFEATFQSTYQEPHWDTIRKFFLDLIEMTSLASLEMDRDLNAESKAVLNIAQSKR